MRGLQERLVAKERHDMSKTVGDPRLRDHTLGERLHVKDLQARGHLPEFTFLGAHFRTLFTVREAPQRIAAPPGRPVTSAPLRCLGRCQAGEVQPSALHETRRCPWPPAHPHGSQLTVTRPGAHGCPFRHSSG